MRYKRFALLFLWLLGILFPMAWLGKFSARYQQIFNAIFAPEWMHWIMHAVLYAGLTVLFVLVFDLPLIGRKVLIVPGVVLLVGIIQESLQLFSGVQVVSWNSGFDLGVDLIGAVVGLGVVWGIRKTSRAGKTPEA